VAATRNNLAMLFQNQRKYIEAEPFYKQALRIEEKALGKEHPNVAVILWNYASLLRDVDRILEAEKMEAQANEILKKRALQKLSCHSRL
jgi:tetratricopeptide (TPR) repeat protein